VTSGAPIASISTTLPRRPFAGVTSAIRRTHWSVRLGGGVFAVICLILILTPWIAPYDPNAQDLTTRLAPPSAAHWLGTDPFGRDILCRLMYGGRYSVSVAAITLVLSGTFGTIVGVLSGRLGGIFDEVAMRGADVLLAFPDILMALVLIAILGPGPETVVVALAVVGWTPFARLARSTTIEVNTRGYIEAAQALGCSQRFITFRHVLPNALTPVLSIGLARFGYQLITVGSLSYLGLGVQPPASDWGSMLATGQPYMQQMPLLVIIPGLTIFLTALSVTIAGQGLSRKRLMLGAAGIPALSTVPLGEGEVG
jgi:ABC-type dipeptide/oligopeptide/nickel transport system permease subunit